jgi:hypothetical protein
MKAGKTVKASKGKTAIATKGEPTPSSKAKPAPINPGARASAVSAGQGRGPLPGGGTTPIDHATHTLWDSGELQQQIGSKNKDKKKIVMRVWCEYFQDTATSYSWSVQCSLKAENKKLIGPGWELVNKLASVSYNFIYKLGSAAPVTKASTITFNNRSDTTAQLIGGSVSSAALLPQFLTRQVTGVRSGGPSGISLTWS